MTPYQVGNEFLLNVEQIIPTPEASDFMVGMMAKEAEEKATRAEQNRAEPVRQEFWSQALRAFHQSSCQLFNDVNPKKETWVSAGSGISAMRFDLIFLKTEIRVEFYMGSYNAELNQLVFDRLSEQRERIDKTFGPGLLDWQPLTNRKACRIVYAKSVDGYDKANWPEMIQWLIEHMTRLEKALRGPLDKVRQELKTTNFSK